MLSSDYVQEVVPEAQCVSGRTVSHQLQVFNAGVL